MKWVRMEALSKKINSCRKCTLGSIRTHAVVGCGSLDAEAMFIGEAPGYHEDQQGTPFVGRAGAILNRLLDHINLRKDDVYIANILKCRPPENRNPQTDEVQKCTPYLNTQIEIIQPRILIPLGNFSYQYLFSIYGLPINKISKDHGKMFYKNTIMGRLMILPMFHPAVATYNPKKIDILMKDFENLKQHLRQTFTKQIGRIPCESHLND